jgi:hypothetical protein
MMSDEKRQPTPFKVGDRVRIVHGREAGTTGVIVLLRRTRGWGNRVEGWQYVVEFGSGRRTYRSETDLVLESQ